MTFAELQSRVRRDLNEAGVTFYSDNDIKEAINEGYQELADATEFYERHWNIELRAKRTYYDLSTLLTGTFLSPRRVYNVNSNRWLDPTDPLQMDRHTWRQWEITQGEPEMYLMRGQWWLGVFPQATTDGAGLRFYGTAIPDAMTSATEEPLELPREFHMTIVDYGVSRLLAEQREPAKALARWKSYIVGEQRVRDYVDGRTRYAAFSVL